MWQADLCLLLGGASLVAGVWDNFGRGWALVAAGVVLIWVGWRAYRAQPRRADETTRSGM